MKQIHLLKIVVSGVQSSEKSSVLEFISGLSLPRGQETVTRCPIELQLRNTPRKEDELQKYGYLNIENTKK